MQREFVYRWFYRKDSFTTTYHWIFLTLLSSILVTQKHITYSPYILGFTLREYEVNKHSDNTAMASILNEGTTKSSLIMSCITELFQCSATYIFHIKAFHDKPHCNALVGLASRLDKPVQFYGILQFLNGRTVRECSLFTILQNSSAKYYTFLLSKYAANG